MSPVVERKGERVSIPSKYILFFLTILCVILIFVSMQSNLVTRTTGTVVGAAIVPFEEGISSVGRFLFNRKEELKQIKDLLAENERLQQQVDELTIENTNLQQDRYELASLRELYALDGTYAEYTKVGARVIAKDTGNWFHNFIVDKGSKDGLKADMNVIAGSGLVGRIVDVGDHWAKVTSIIADNSNVSGMVLSTEDQLMVTGDLELYSEGLIRFEKLVDKADKVVEGDKIVTSNISDKYLPGILIGYISEIDVDSNKLTKSGLITPAVDFEHIDEVLILLETKQNAEWDFD